MSLLFDALQRASKEKAAKAAAAPSTNDAPQAPSPTSEAPLEFSFTPPAAPAPQDKTPEPAAPSPEASASPNAPLELSLSPAPSPASGRGETPPEAAHTPPPPAPEPLAKKPSQAPQPAAAKPPQPLERPSAKRSPQVAREILKASVLPARRGPSKLLMAFAGIAVLLALSLGALFLFEALNNPSGLATPQLAQTPAPATDSVPAALPAAAPQTVPAPVAEAPQAAPAEVAAPQPPAAARQEEPAPASMRARPVFTAKPGGSRTLDAAYAALLDGRLEAAAASYRQALARNPDERDALLGLAHIAHRQGRNDEARAFYQGVLRLEPDHPVANAGLLALADADSEYPVSRARAMAEQNPESAAAQSALGSALARAGLIADAQQAFFQAMTLEPDSPLHAYNLAVALDRLHKVDLAKTYYERALSLADQASAGVRKNFPQQAARDRLEQLRSDGVAKP